MKFDVLYTAKENAKNITRWRRSLHSIPETGLFLPRTASFIQTCLKEMDIPFRTYETHSGISVVLGDPNAGKCVALRADMDALPLQEQTGVPFRSCNENMHACGHDAHAAMLLGALKILKAHESELNGCIKLIFQPGEETGDGAKSMIRDGILEDPKVDALIALHVDRTASDTVKQGDIIIKRGPMHASNDDFEITIAGRGGHGGYPHRSIDPTVCAGLLINAFQTIVSREIDPLASAVISFGNIHTATTASNIIPESVLLAGTIRCGKEETRKYVKQRLEEITKGICHAMRTECEINIRCGEPSVENDDSVADIVENAAIRLFGSAQVHSVREQVMGAEDAGYYFQEVPGCLFRFCNPRPFSDGVIYPLHSNKMLLEDSNLYRGTALLVQSALDYLASP